MTHKTINPDSVVLSQLQGHWQKMAMLILWKLNGRQPVKITAEDMMRFNAEFAPGIPCLYTHGHSDSIDFQIVDEERARALAVHDATMRGRA